jgi:hypothetical protein
MNLSESNNSKIIITDGKTPIMGLPDWIAQRNLVAARA